MTGAGPAAGLGGLEQPVEQTDRLVERGRLRSSRNSSSSARARVTCSNSRR